MAKESGAKISMIRVLLIVFEMSLTLLLTFNIGAYFNGCSNVSTNSSVDFSDLLTQDVQCHRFDQHLT